jgi:hypothetical protein
MTLHPIPPKGVLRQHQLTNAQYPLRSSFKLSQLYGPPLASIAKWQAFVGACHLKVQMTR